MGCGGLIGAKNDIRSRVLYVAALVGALAAAPTAFAQQGGGRLSAAQSDIGQLEARIQQYDQALGVVARFRRPSGDETECYGACFFPSSSQPVSWRCAPQETCDLHCDVNPPVGGCH